MLSIESLMHRLNLRDKMIDILQRDYTNHFEEIKLRIFGWFYARKIKRLSS